MDDVGIIRGRLLDMPTRGHHCCQGAEIRISADTFGDVELKHDHAKHDLLLMPPLANAHDHVRGVRPISLGAFDLPLELWLTYMSKPPPVDPYLVTAAALGRQVLGGVGSIMIHYTRPQNPDSLGDELGVVAKAAADIGVRVAIAVAMRDQNPLGYGPNDQLLDGLSSEDRATIQKKLVVQPASPQQMVQFVDELAAKIETPLVSVQYGPYGVEWCSKPLLELIAKRSAITGRRVHMHLLESRTQREYLDHIYPQGPIRYLDQIGLLSERLSVAHGVWLRSDELELLAERGVTVCVNSTSNLSLRSGVSPVREMHRRGVPIAMGLDGFSVDDDDDAFRELRLNYLLHQGLTLEDGLSVSDLMHASSYGGRFSVTGIEASEGIAEHAPADLMVLDYAKISQDVVMDLDEAAILVRRGTSRILKQLIVAGRPIAKDGRLTGIDLPGIQEELNAQVRRGIREFQSWQDIAGRLRNNLRAFYSAGLHRCG